MKFDDSMSTKHVGKFLQDDHPSQSQSQRPSSSQRVEDEEMEEVDCTQEGKSKKSQKELSKEELNRKVSELVRYLLFMDRKKYPIKRGDITKNMLKEHSKAFTQVFDHAKKTLEKVFGIEVEEIDVGKSKGYILVTAKKTEGEDELLHWGDDLPKMGLLMVILSLIFMSNNVITESLLWHTLKNLGIEPKLPPLVNDTDTIVIEPRVEHEVFGDPDKLISQEFVRQCYLDRKKVVGDETAYEYRWGSRAEKELTKRQVLQFVSKLYDTEMDSWTTQMKEILAEEEKAMNGVE